MFRNQYDGDNTTWSPQGRIHQVEYAMEAVKQGSCCVGLKSNKAAVLVVLKRSSSELAAFQKKIIKVDKHIGVGFSGLTSDARVLTYLLFISNFMRNEAMKSQMIYNRPLPVSRIVSLIGEKAQINTQRYGKRPYGVGLLVIGYDNSGPKLYECSPSGNYFDYTAVAIGSRSQSAKTYLEKHFEEFGECEVDDLIVHGLKAIRDSAGEKELSIDNCSVSIVGFGIEFIKLENQDLLK